MASGAKLAEVHFYFDADVLGLAKVIAPLRPDVTYPGESGATVNRRTRPPYIITSPATLDRDWIPTVANQGWLVITRDSRIAQHHAEVSAVRENDCKLVALGGQDAMGTWAQLEIVMTQWRQLEKLQLQPGPFIYRMTRTALTRVEID